MDSISAVGAVITPSYQDASPHTIHAAMAACVRVQKRKGEISPANMAELNNAVEHGLGSSTVLATAFCKTVKHIVWDAGANEQNRITAGVYTVELVLLAMTSHVCDADVQEEGASALAGLAVRNPVNIAGMLALGVPVALITSADTHIASRNVQRSVCAALCAIAQYSADGRAALRASCAAYVATRAKATHSNLYWPHKLLSTLSAV